MRLDARPIGSPSHPHQTGGMSSCSHQQKPSRRCCGPCPVSGFAPAMAAWIDRPARFAGNKRIGFGLVPCQDTSAGKERLGLITQAVLGAQTVDRSRQAIRRSPEVRHCERVQRGDPKKKNRPDCHRPLPGQGDAGQADQRPGMESRSGGGARASGKGCGIAQSRCRTGCMAHGDAVPLKGAGPDRFPGAFLKKKRCRRDACRIPFPVPLPTGHDACS